MSELPVVTPGTAGAAGLFSPPAAGTAGAWPAAGSIAAGIAGTSGAAPTGQVTLTPTELAAIQKWIADGAAAPTQN